MTERPLCSVGCCAPAHAPHSNIGAHAITSRALRQTLIAYLPIGSATCVPHRGGARVGGILGESPFWRQWLLILQTIRRGPAPAAGCCPPRRGVALAGRLA